MPHAFDVPASALLPRVAAELKGRQLVQPPHWAAYVKTGVSRQQAPSQPDWWYLRSASVLRKIFLEGTTGVQRLSAAYGGRRDRGSAPYHARSGSRAVLREIVQQLERSGLVKAHKNLGRRVSPEGRKLLDGAARAALTELAKSRPELAKYL